ncbi:MAG TPA: ABC transporter permease [Paenirhodobacter sp.]
MVRFLAIRVAQTILLLWLMSVIVFVALFALGDPVSTFINPASPPEVINAAMRNLGLDQPMHIQYLRFVEGALKGELGNSYMSGRPALKLIAERLPATMELAGFALLIATVFGIPLGLYGGFHPKSVLARGVEMFSLICVSLPAFWTALLLIVWFAVWAGLLPTGGRGETRIVLGVPLSFVTLDGLRHLILPAINLSVYPMALLMRLTRAGVHETLSSSFIRFARAKGLHPTRILFVYVMRAILPQLVTVMGMVAGGLLAFAVITETVFAWPGTGKLVVDAIQTSDRPVIIAYLLFTVLLFSIINLVVDIVFAMLDPRGVVGGQD